MATHFSGARNRRAAPVVAATTVAIVGALIATAIWLMVAGYLEQRVHDRLVVLSESLAASIERSASEIQADLSAVAGLFETSDTVTIQDFGWFVDRIGIARGLGGIAYAPLVGADELMAHEDAARLELPDYHVFEIDETGARVDVRDRDEYLPVRYFEPPEAFGGALGFDAASIPGRAPFIEKAVRTKGPVTTPLTQVALAEDRGYVAYLAVVGSSGEVVGLVIGPVVYNALIDGAVTPGVAAALDWSLSDTDGRSGDTTGTLVHETELTVGDRTWTLRAAPLEGSSLALEAWRPAAIVGLAALLAAFIAAYATYSFWRRVQSEAHVGEMMALVSDKDRFVATVSHELRTPLAALLGFSELLKDSGNIRISPNERQEMIAVIAEQASDLTNIVDDLLVVARADHGTLAAVSVPVDLAAQCRQVVEQLGGARKLTIQIAAGCQDLRATGDPARVRQIVRNLVNNAVAYGGADIRVSVHVEADEIVAQVRDDGLGIPDADSEAVFEAYHRAHDIGPTTGSLGLGLSVSRTLARHMGGEVIYRRSAGYTIFELRLPVYSTSIATTQPNMVAGSRN